MKTLNSRAKLSVCLEPKDRIKTFSHRTTFGPELVVFQISDRGQKPRRNEPR